MKENFEDAFYYFTVFFCTSIIVLGLIGLVAKIIIHFNK